MKESPRDLSIGEVRRIADQAEGLKRAVLHGIGEPLLNPELPGMVHYLKGKGATVLFNSNGHLLSSEWAEQLISSGLDEFRVSLDAATEFTYTRIRSSEYFLRVISNIEMLIRMRNESRLSSPTVSAWMVGTKENIRDLPDMILLASRVGIDEVYLQRLVYPLDGAGHGLASRENAISGSHEEILEIVERSMALSHSLGVRPMASGLTNPSESLRSRSREQAPWRRCKRPWEVAYITAWGNLLPCCISPFSTLDYDSLILGNVFEQSLEQIWNGEKYSEFRGRHQSSNPPAGCSGCGVEWSL
jgi:radical SAM protein with 4Fe4S-binding SPASM domain